MNFPTFSIPALVLLVLSSAAGQDRVVLRLTDWADSEELGLTQACLAEFQRRHPTVEVLYEPNPGRQYEEKILTALAADSPPDVFLLDSKLIPTFTDRHVLQDLTPYLGSQGIDTAQWFPNVLAIGRRGGALYAFPKGFTPLMIYYNRRAFLDAGVAPPLPGWTWDDFLGTARSLTRDADGDGTPEVYGTAFTNYYYYWIPWVWSAGGDVVSPDGRRATGFLDAPAALAAFRWLIDLRTVHRVAPDAGTWVQEEKTGSRNALFVNGKIAMVVDGHWRMPRFLPAIRSGALDLGVAPLPRHASGQAVNVLYESGWCVPVNTPHPAEAVALAAFMAGEHACRIRSHSRLELPSVRTVAEEIVASDSTGIESEFLRAVPLCRQPWGSIIERFSEIEWTLQDALDEALVHGSPLHEVMRDAAVRIDGQLEEIRKHGVSPFSPLRAQSGMLEFLAGVTAVVFLLCAALYLRAGRESRRRTGTALGFLAPSLLHLIFFIFTPIAFAAYLSTHRWDLIVADKPFVGLANVIEIFRDADFWNALKNTAAYTVNVPLGMMLSLGVALMMHRRLKGLGFLRTLYFLPSVTSFVAIALVWMWIYHPSFGAANYLLGLAGLPPLQWLNAPETAMIAVIIFSIWMGIGYQMVIFLAGLQGIPGEYYEAARMDGAGRWRQFAHVTWPLLKPTTFFILVTSMIGSFQVFTSVYIMTAGGPVRSTDVVVYHIYQAAWEQLRMGYASAMSWVLFVIIMAATWIQFRLMGKEVEY
jgi:ABC-type sugar transport system permease subunit/ABC-type glycerol-3-phosphate transport system substrate-binding protein